MNPIFWTNSSARLQCIASNAREKYNWIFLPGGPGLGSESVLALAELLDLPGKTWLLDLPGDGGNTTENDSKSFSNWEVAIKEVVESLENIILVAHSSGGMFVLATRDIEKHLLGLILMNSAPDASWQTTFAEYVKTHPIPEIEKLQKQFELNPSNETLKRFTIACFPYFSTEKSVEKVKAIFEKLPFNYQSFEWAKTHFDPIYQANWIPQKIPTLIFAGDQDPLTPLSLFSKRLEFHRPNIKILEIPHASHFPWLDNPEAVKQAFEDFQAWLE